MSARLTLRARQILADPTLSQNQQIPHPDVLLTSLRAQVQANPDYLASVLEGIDDPDVQQAMLSALTS